MFEQFWRKQNTYDSASYGHSNLSRCQPSYTYKKCTKFSRLWTTNWWISRQIQKKFCYINKPSIGSHICKRPRKPEINSKHIDADGKQIKYVNEQGTDEKKPKEREEDLPIRNTTINKDNKIIDHNIAEDLSPISIEDQTKHNKNTGKQK